jgi:hypothetical protein
MQPFDGGVYDARFKEVFVPAIKDAGLEPYRVDQDPAVSIPIADIERGIRDCRVCLAEITQDNPNVWFELGYAIACGKDVVLVCSDERKAKFPFDVQHRTIITYRNGSPSDFEALGSQITAKLKASVDKSQKLTSFSEFAKVAQIEGLSVHEMVCLAAIAENVDHLEDHASSYLVKRDMEASGFTKLAATISLASLSRKSLIESQSVYDQHSEEHYTAYTLTESGWNWVLSNQDQFTLRRPSKADDESPF